MYRRDYFLKLLQQFTKFLSKLMGLKEAGEIEQAIQFIQNGYKEFFGLEGDYLKNIPVEELVNRLINEHDISDERLETLARFFYEDSDLQPHQSEDLLTKALEILNYLNIHQKLYSFEREALIEQIQNKLSQI